MDMDQVREMLADTEQRFARVRENVQQLEGALAGAREELVRLQGEYRAYKAILGEDQDPGAQGPVPVESDEEAAQA